MAYIFSVNNAPATGAIAMYQLIATLLSAGWLKKMDSDGYTYSSVGSQVTGGHVGVNGLGNSNAWVRLQSPPVNGGSIINQKREITIQRGTTDVPWRIKYSASALFTGGSPAINVTPTSTDEIFMLGAGTDASPTFTANWFTTNSTYRWHVACGGAAESYSFVAWGVLNGSITTNSAMIALDVMTPGSYSPLDVDPAVMFCSRASGVNSADLMTVSFASSTVTNPALARAWMGPTSALGATTTGTNVNVSILPYGTSQLGNGGQVGSNPWTKKDDLLPCLWGSVNPTTVRGVKGFSTLFLHGSLNRGPMDTIDTTVPGAKDKVHFLNLWLPWSGETPII